MFITDISGIRPKVSQSRIAKIITDSTSGTTGESKRVYYTERDLLRTVEIFAQGISEMHPGRVLVCFPNTGEWSLGDLIARAVAELGAVPVPVAPALSYTELTALADRQRTDSFIGFPQTLLALQRITGGCFDAGLISGDYCIKADYMCPVYPHYGSREMCLAGAISCSCRSGMHMRSDVDIEIIDKAGNQVPDGIEGELVITTHLEAMPLERYRTGDYTYIIPELCTCGSENIRIGPVRRRAAIETLDDEAFADRNLIDWRGDIKLYKNDIKEDTVPLYSSKRY